MFSLIFLLTGKAEAGAIAGILFGIHPMHVESVAWISSRKDVLLGLFFLAGSISWLRFRSDPAKQRPAYGLTLLFFILSLLSKSVAVVFPVILLGFDYLRKRDDWKEMLIEKLFRDARASLIEDGTNEVMALSAARKVIDTY